MQDEGNNGAAVEGLILPVIGSPIFWGARACST